jgi:SurA-like N-terminal domain
MMAPAMLKLFFLAALPLLAQMPPPNFQDSGKKIAVQNSILAKVNGTTISMLDVKKKMDMVFYQHYANLSHSNTARYQFYEKSWRPVLMEMIDHELILADAQEKEIKLNDSEIRETMENRFGPNVLSTLDHIGLTYDEAWKMLKNELIVQRMNWWFVQAKAIQSVTPQSIRDAYQSYLKNNPSYQELKYRIVSIRGDDLASKSEKALQVLTEKGGNPELLVDALLEIDPSIQVSAEYTASDLEISESHRSALSSMTPGSYSAPLIQKSRSDNKSIARIFYLAAKADHSAPAFQELSSDLREGLVNKAIAEHSKTYVAKLRKHFGFDTEFIKEKFPEDLHPFSLQ